MNDKATETIKAAAANIGRAFQALGKDHDAARIEAGDVRKGQFAPTEFVDMRSGTIPPPMPAKATDGPENPSRSAISDEDRASIRKIGEKLFGWTVPTVFEHMVAEGVRERDTILELTADRDAERDRAKGLAILLERAHERYDESRELLAKAGIRMVQIEGERDAAIDTIDMLREIILLRDAEIEDLRAQIARLDHDIASREHATLRRDERIAELFGLVEARDRLLDRILDLVIDAKGGEARPEDALDDEEWSNAKGGK